MTDTIRNMMDEYTRHLREIYGDHLVSVRLYGSQARGDAGPDSDIDVMVLVDIPRKQRSAYSDALFSMTYAFDQTYDTLTMPCVENVDFFQHWAGVAPFFQNVELDGVVLYAKE